MSDENKKATMNTEHQVSNAEEGEKAFTRLLRMMLKGVSATGDPNATSVAALAEIRDKSGHEFQIQIRLTPDKEEWMGKEEIYVHSDNPVEGVPKDSVVKIPLSKGGAA